MFRIFGFQYSGRNSTTPTGAFTYELNVSSATPLAWSKSSHEPTNRVTTSAYDLAAPGGAGPKRWRVTVMDPRGQTRVLFRDATENVVAVEEHIGGRSRKTMSEITWSFVEFVQWLRAKSEALKLSSDFVEFDVQNAARASARLRVERGKRLGELTVWDDGAAHMAILDLQSGDFVFERGGVSFADTPVERGLQEFFDQLIVAV